MKLMTSACFLVFAGCSAATVGSSPPSAAPGAEAPAAHSPDASVRILARGGDSSIDPTDDALPDGGLVPVVVRDGEVVAWAQVEMEAAAPLSLVTSWAEAQTRDAVIKALGVTVAESVSERSVGGEDAPVEVSQHNVELARGIFTQLPKPRTAWVKLATGEGERVRVRARLALPKEEVRLAVERALAELGAPLVDATDMLRRLEEAR